jgi:amino acid transporter
MEIKKGAVFKRLLFLFPKRGGDSMTLIKIVSITVALCFYLSCFFGGVNVGFNVYIAAGLIILAFLVSYLVHAIAHIGLCEKSNPMGKQGETNEQKSIDNQE